MIKIVEAVYDLFIMSDIEVVLSLIYGRVLTKIGISFQEERVVN